MTKIIGGHIPPKEHAKLRLEDAADKILDRIIFAKRIEERGTRKDCLFLPHEMGPMWLEVEIKPSQFDIERNSA